MEEGVQQVRSAQAGASQISGQRHYNNQAEKIFISPNLVAAYIINIGKAVLFIAAVIGAFYFVQYLVGSNPFVEIIEFIGIPMVWLERAAYALIALFFLSAFFSTLSLTSYELIFDGNNLNYSYGSFIKVSRSTQVSNIIRVNFKEYSPLSLGELTLELSGTEDKSLKLQFVGKVKENADLINNLINQNKSATLQRVDMEVGL